ncbi:MAG: KOW motif-containing protein, partial [Clostridia bacterium]|nr:KOW motif-containing protein [Clostridia bacterium]
KALPLSETDFASIFEQVPQVRTDIEVGDEVRILTGLFENFTGKVTAIDPVSQQLSVTVPMLKRETSVELAYDEVVRVD